MTNLKNNLREHFLKKELSTEQINRLQNKTFPKLIWGGALAFCMAVFFIFLNPKLETKMMEEIAYNHHKNLKIEISSSKLIEIQKALPKLDFKIARSVKFPKSEWKILGARYCSLDSKIAVQIKLLNLKSGDSYTLYQTQMNSDLKTNKAKTMINGTKVELWKEYGLVMGVAGPK